MHTADSEFQSEIDEGKGVGEEISHALIGT